jgi:hypothetical protein
MAKEISQAEINALADLFGISNESIKRDGNNLSVGGYLDLSGTQITEPKKINRPSILFSVELKLAIECRFNARGSSIADGILARILSSKGAVKKIRIVGKKNYSYLVVDENGNYAHGETIAQAREDLIYKAIAKFDGPIPENATGKNGWESTEVSPAHVPQELKCLLKIAVKI